MRPYFIVPLYKAIKKKKKRYKYYCYLLVLDLINLVDESVLFASVRQDNCNYLIIVSILTLFFSLTIVCYKVKILRGGGAIRIATYKLSIVRK